MSTRLFTDEEIEFLSKNPYVLVVSERAITYSEEFKSIVIAEHQNGEMSRKIFEKYGFPYFLVGRGRIRGCVHRWIKQTKREDGLRDTRKTKSGRPLKRRLLESEEIERLKHKVLVLEQENSYLKKIRLIEKDASRKA